MNKIGEPAFFLQNHERFHTGEKPFRCGECDKAFTLKCTLVEHIKAKHENIKYRCEHCDHVLNSKMALKTHMGTKHATIKPYACGDCGSCFALQSLLTAHMNQKHRDTAHSPMLYKLKEHLVYLGFFDSILFRFSRFKYIVSNCGINVAY
jgi:uncharacterized Zn-finger protein